MNDPLAGYGAGHADATDKYMKEVAVLRTEVRIMLKILKQIKASDDIVEVGCLADEAIERVSDSQSTENTSNFHKAEVSGTSNG